MVKITSFIVGFAFVASVELTDLPNLNGPDCKQLPTVFNETCCDAPELASQSMLDKCFDEVENSTRGQNLSDHVQGCKINDCILKQQNFLTANELYGKKVLDLMAKQKIDHKLWNEPMEKVLGDCLASAKTNKDKILKVMSEEPFSISTKHCNPISYYITTCLYYNLISVCPASKWNRSDDCDSLQSFIKKCGTEIETIKFWFVMEN